MTLTITLLIRAVVLRSLQRSVGTRPIMEMRLIVLALLLVGSTQGQSPENVVKHQLQFTIDKTWNGSSLTPAQEIHITLRGVTNSKDVRVRVEAPYYDDPAPNAKPGETFEGLWKTEVVEVYFLNDKKQYLQLQLSPHGQRTVFFYNGERNRALLGLPLDYSSLIKDSTWVGSALIPGDYFPPQVTKFNAASMHGICNKQRQYYSLYPANATALTPDFHKLALFKPIKMSLLGSLHTDKTLSPTWDSAVKGEFPFIISKTWDGKEIPKSDRVKVVLKKVENKDGVLVKIEAPYYDEPNKKQGKYQAVEVFFLNRDDQYLQVGVRSIGQPFGLLLNGEKNYLRSANFVLNATSKIQGSSWTVEFMIPANYFPPAVTKISANSRYFLGGEQHFLTLTPSTVPVQKPDFHNIIFFQPFDISNLIDVNRDVLSPIWNLALRREFQYVIKNSWDVKILPLKDQITVTLKWIENTKDINVMIEAPFYNDPVMNGSVNPFSLWRYEVVEVYFANDNDQYLQVMLAPKGEYFVLLFNGERNRVRHSLPLQFSPIIQGSRWVGEARIPADYLPPQVTKFSTTSGHGNRKNRKFTSLNPQYRLQIYPNFHDLTRFGGLNLKNLHPALANNPLSPLWKLALKGEYRFKITQTWDGKPIPENEVVDIILNVKKFENSKDVSVRIESPFYNDTAPNGEPGQSFKGLWYHEVVEVYFLNENDQYLQIEFAPKGQYFVILLDGKRNAIKHYLLLNIETNIEGSKWTAETTIPGDYLPPLVTKFSASAIHGEGTQRKYITLSPFPASANATKPDFHNLEFFQPLPTRQLGRFTLEKELKLSPLWKASLKEV